MFEQQLWTELREGGALDWTQAMLGNSAANGIPSLRLVNDFNKVLDLPVCAKDAAEQLLGGH